MSDLERLPPTEGVDEATRGLDTLLPDELIATLLRSQRRAFDAVSAAGPVLAQAAERIAALLEAGGSLHYCGAGTSGRLGVLDAAECPPTFSTPPELVRAHIAGGAEALVRAVEGAEDDAVAGDTEARRAIRPGDAVVGISASGGAPYVIAFVAAARAAGAFTVALSSRADSPLGSVADLSIALETGAEPLAGSTRLVAGTAQKLALNALSTAVMVRLGKVYDNLMVDVTATNAKLRARSLRLVARLTDCDVDTAQALLERADGKVKVAVVMARRDVDARVARELLARSGGRLRAVLEAAEREPATMRLATFDEIAIALAYYRSPVWAEVLRTKQTEREAAERANDAAEIDALDAWGAQSLQRAEKQLALLAGLDNILDVLQPAFRDIERSANVSAVVPSGDAPPDAQTVDVTGTLLDRLAADQKTRDLIRELQAAHGTSLEQ